MRHLLLPFLFGLCGCELYFTDSKQVPPDTHVKPTDASVACPSDPPPDGLKGIITSPTDGATVTQPVEVVWRWSDPSQDARKFMVLVDQQGDHVSQGYPCATMPPTNGDNVNCFDMLTPNTKYTFRMYWICYNENPSLTPMNAVSFVTAP